MNKRALNAEIVRNGYTCTQLARELGMNKGTFSKKMNGASEFKQSEIEKIVRLLNIEDPMAIFFDSKVS